MANVEFTTEELASEEWRPVVGWEALYSVSNLGRIRSEARIIVRRDGKPQPVKSSVLRPRLGRDGYLYFALRYPGRIDAVKVHRIVTAAFHEIDMDRLSVDHIDCVKTNNRASNLRRCSPSENSRFMRESGRQARGGRNSHAKLTADDVAEIRSMYAAGGVSQPALGKRYGVTHATIGFIVRRVSWTHVY